MLTYYYTCPSCEENMLVKVGRPSDRSALERERGELLSVNCNACADRRRIHVNDVKASPMKAIVIGAGLVAAVLTALFWNLGFIASVTLALPVLVYSTLNTSAANFNKYRIKRTQHPLGPTRKRLE